MISHDWSNVFLLQEGLQEKLWDVGERGFLPAVDPVKELPAPWEPWNHHRWTAGSVEGVNPQNQLGVSYGKMDYIHKVDYIHKMDDTTSYP